MGKIDKKILVLLSEHDSLTLVEIAEKLNEKNKTVFKALRRLFEKGQISNNPKTRKYQLTTQ
jgi:DNA-binding IclR family transcriptional regulator